MKILLDANISWKLITTLKPIFGECAHVDLIGLNVPASDIDIWDYALKNGYIIITKDNDFVDLLELKSFPPKVVLLKTGNNSSKALSELLINIKPMIEDLKNNDYGLLEIIIVCPPPIHFANQNGSNYLFGA
jgi:predicted nuclease of predicted toxin-antitoxin system